MEKENKNSIVPLLSDPLPTWNIIPALQKVLGPHSVFRNWTEVEATTSSLNKDSSGREEKTKAVRFTQIRTFSVFPYFRFCLHVLFSMNSLIVSTNWDLKMWFHLFYVILLNLYLKLYQSSYDFNLTDPCCQVLETSYKSLRDPHLKAYYKQKDTLWKLKKGGNITSNNKVGQSLLSVNQQKPLGS